MRHFQDVINLVEASRASWPILDFGEWPTGFRHDFSWHCTKRALHVARQWEQEPKQGSWYALAAKRQWMAGKITTHAMKKTIQMAQLSMLPDEIETGGSWFQQERDDYENILSGIQEDLSSQERAWIEADTSRYIAQDALARITWSTIQLEPPQLHDIIRMFHRAIRNMAATQAWSQPNHLDWDTIQNTVRQQVRQQFVAEESWQKDKLLHLLTLHQEYRLKLCNLLQHQNHNKEHLQKHWHQHMEEALFS